MRKRLPSFLQGASCLLWVWAAAASAQTPPAQPPAKTPVAKAAPDALPIAPAYRLGPEDMVEIAVWREEGLKKEVLVRPDGLISFPLAGEVIAAGRTAVEIRDDITQRLQRYLSDPVVSVTVTRIAAQKFYVIGRVNKPGEYLSGRYIDVMQALSMAGGLTPFASPNDIRVLRREGTKELVIPFRYSDVAKGRDLQQNILLNPGDVVVVP